MEVNLRPIHPTDVPGMKHLFYTLSQETLYYRFMARVKKVNQKEIQNYVYVDHRNEVAIVCTLPDVHGEEIIAIGRYYLDTKTNRAEIAFVVRDEWQNQGIGSFLYKHLTSIAKRNGLSGFTAEVLRENRAMQTVLNKSAGSVRSEAAEGAISYRIDFA